MTRPVLVVAVIALVFATGCGDKKTRDENVPLDITIDWVPSPEYYGFFYAVHHGIYRNYGLKVTIHNGSGAPVVASQLAAGAAYIGTTTSDNLLRQVARGGRFERAVPLQLFNPCVVVSSSAAPIVGITDLRGKTIGTNKQSSVYLQFLAAAQRKGLRTSEFAEYPIGWGGAEQLKMGIVAAFLAYSTNAVVDLELAQTPVNELFLSDLGIQSYGLVLVVGRSDKWPKGVDSTIIDKFCLATFEGYSQGLSDIPGAVNALLSVEPTLQREKVARAIEKIGHLNETKIIPPGNVDSWVDDISSEARLTARNLYKNP